MGQAKNLLIEKQEHERQCPECNDTVWVNWGESPSFHCESCEQDYNVVQCENCTNLIHSSDEAIVCDDCIEYAMRD